MTNYDKHKYRILAEVTSCTMRMKLLGDINCKDEDIFCKGCTKKFEEWLKQEADEESVDWSKVEKNCPVEISTDGENWEKRHFSKFEKGFVHVYMDGKTSYTTDEDIPYNYARMSK